MAERDDQTGASLGRDIAVVGGSAAGLLTAQRLAAAGRDVVVFERSRDLDPSERSLIVTHRMRDLLGPLGTKAVRTHVDRFELFADGKVAEIKLRDPDLVIERATLIRELGHAARSAGAELVFGQRATGLAPEADHLRLRLGSNGSGSEIRARTVIGADGAQSAIARFGGWPRLPVVSLIQAIVTPPKDVSPHTSRIWFRPQDTPFFYWYIPETDGRGALGVIGEDGPETRRRLDAFLDEKGLEPLDYQAAVIPAYRRWVHPHRRLGDADVFLVGDAAGQVKVSTVGGIVTGFRGAEGVATRILTGSRRHLRPLRRELTLHLLIHRALRQFSQDDYVYLLDRLNPRVQRSMTITSRDEAARILLSLCRSQPRFLIKGLRALFAGRLDIPA